MNAALRFVLSEPWAMTAEAVQTLHAIARRANEEPESVAARLGRPLDNTHKVSERDGVATIPVRGPISRYANLFTEISGATSVQKLATDLQAAVDNPRVKSICMEIDSPGGQANGIAELAGHIKEAAKVKPVCAYISGMGCSAAYWLASSASDVVVSPTAVVGSIGVIMAVDTDEDDDEMRFVSSQSPKKDADPKTQQGAEEIQALVDSLAQVFIDDVARNRGMKPEEVVSRFGEGGVKVGQNAVDAGMADAVSSYEEVHGKLARGEKPVPAKSKPVPPSKSVPSSKPVTSTQGKLPMTLFDRVGAWLARSKPEVFNEAVVATASEEAPATIPFPADTLRLLAMGSTSRTATPLHVHKTEEEIEAKANEKARKTLAAAFGKQADVYLASEVKAERIVPADVPKLKALYVAFALADDADPIAFEANGKEATASRLDFLTETLAARSKNGKTTESVISDPKRLPNGVRAFPNQHAEEKPEKSTPDELAKLLAMTDAGKAALAEITRNNLSAASR